MPLTPTPKPDTLNTKLPKPPLTLTANTYTDTQMKSLPGKLVVNARTALCEKTSSLEQLEGLGISNPKGSHILWIS